MLHRKCFAGCHLQCTIIIIIIYPLTARVVGAPQMISQPVSSIFPSSPLPSWTCRTPGLSIPWCCLPAFSSVCLVFFPPFTVPSKMVLARSDEWETWPYHCSLRLFTMVRRSSCGPIACWVVYATEKNVTRDVTDSVYYTRKKCCARCEWQYIRYKTNKQTNKQNRLH